MLPTMGGQTALNTALALFKDGTLEKYGVTHDRRRRRGDREGRGPAEVPRGDGPDRARKPALGDRPQRSTTPWRHWTTIGLPAIIRPSFTLGGTGGGIAYNRDEFVEIVRGGLEASPTTEVLIEESVLGWKEYEMEVVRDRADNAIIICSIENVDPMGIHTGDSITVAPALTLTDKEYQIMRNASIAVPARNRRRNRRFQRPVRGQSEGRPAGRDRDEPARQPLLGAGLEGDRLPDRQGRGQAGGRLHARRDPERHHRRHARPASSRRSTMSSPRSRASPSRSSRAPRRCSRPR